MVQKSSLWFKVRVYFQRQHSNNIRAAPEKLDWALGAGRMGASEEDKRPVALGLGGPGRDWRMAGNHAASPILAMPLGSVGHFTRLSNKISFPHGL